VRAVPWFLWIVTSAATVRADPAPQAFEHYKIASVHYRAGEYEQAIAELRIAFSTSPEPQYLFAMGQAFRASGDCAHANESYHAYLRTGPTSTATRETQLLVDECDTKLAAERTAEPAAAPAPAPPPGPPKDPLVIREVQWVRTRETFIPWYRDWRGDALVGAGTTSLVVGTIALVLASHHDDAATRAVGYSGFDSEIRARDRDQQIGAVALTVGTALIGGGLLRYALRPKTLRTEVIVDPTNGGVTVGAAWRM
jgi:hypothetical protein